MIETLKTAVSTIGIDIGKNWFHVVGLYRRGAIVLHQERSFGHFAGTKQKIAPTPQVQVPSGT